MAPIGAVRVGLRKNTLNGKFAESNASFGRQVTQDAFRTTDPNLAFQFGTGLLRIRLFKTSGADETLNTFFFSDNVQFNAGTTIHDLDGVGISSNGSPLTFTTDSLNPNWNRFGFIGISQVDGRTVFAFGMNGGIRVPASQ